MRIAVVSDTHLPRFSARAGEAFARIAAQEPGFILHCGDMTDAAAVATLERIAPVEAVAGNNDGPDIVARFGRRKVVTLDGRRIGLIHGDGRRGTTLGRARRAFEGEPLDAIAFGHSHEPYLELHDGIWVVNPGSPTDKRRQPHFSFAVLETNPGASLGARLVYF